MSRGPLFFLFLLLSCVKPDFEDKSITTSLDLGVKRVRTYYVDTYGDQLNRDGKLVGEALFADDGSLMNIKTSRMNLSEHQSPAVWIERYSGIPVNRLIWELDGGIYGRDWWGIRKFLTSGPEYAFDVGKDKATTHLETQKMYEDGALGEYQLNIDNPEHPSVIEYSAKTLNPENKEITFVSTSREEFRYDTKGRLISLSRKGEWNRDGHINPYNSESTYTYDSQGYLSRFDQENFMIEIFRNQYAQVEKITITKGGKVVRWYTYSYLDNDLRESSQAFNSDGELEFVIEYEYEFY